MVGDAERRQLVTSARFAAGVACAMLAAVALCADNAPQPAGRIVISDPRNPAPWTEVHPAARRDFDLGHTIFNSPWFPAGHAGAGRRDGLGPLLVQSSCDGCHNNGARGSPPAAPGALSNSFVMQLGGAATDYGHVINTLAIDGHVPEARIQVEWQPRTGRYPDGQRWSLNEPRYAVVDATLGALPGGTILKPRIGPALFGAGLLDGVPLATIDAIRQAQSRRVRGSIGGRFGWQGDAPTLVDQTALALAREMGVTSDLQPRDDCTAAQPACLQAPHGGTPEASEQFFHALNTFQFLLGVPARAAVEPGVDAAGARLFERTGCAACHVPQLVVPREVGALGIDPYSDLLLHDLGEGLADRTADGRPVRSRWRTAPLWGLAHALREGQVALLHDGRAASIEAAILWHEGQASDSRRRFMRLDAATRRQLLDWVATL